VLLAQRCTCALCGRAYAIVLPPGEPERERDKLCPECSSLPAVGTMSVRFVADGPLKSYVRMMRTPRMVSHSRTRVHDFGSSLFQRVIAFSEIATTRRRRWWTAFTSFAKSVGLWRSACKSSSTVAPDLEGVKAVATAS